MSLAASITDEPLIFQSLGPTAFLIFYTPHAPSAAPKNALIGHLIGVVAGYLALSIFGLSEAGPALVEGVTLARTGVATLPLGLTAGPHGLGAGAAPTRGSDHSDRQPRDLDRAVPARGPDARWCCCWCFRVPRSTDWPGSGTRCGVPPGITEAGAGWRADRVAVQVHIRAVSDSQRARPTECPTRRRSRRRRPRLSEMIARPVRLAMLCTVTAKGQRGPPIAAPFTQRVGGTRFPAPQSPGAASSRSRCCSPDSTILGSRRANWPVAVKTGRPPCTIVSS